MSTLFEGRPPTGDGLKLKIAVEGCGHGSLDAIYKSVEKSCEAKGWTLSNLDFLIICGDFQAVRNKLDLNCMAVPVKYREIGEFHAYYSGAKKAPVLTFVIGGNHEASNHFFELYHGGWLAENIYYMGAANVIKYGPFRIAGMSGIWKAYDFRKAHHERLPYNRDDVFSAFHVRDYDVRKLLQIRSQVDIGISHDWPRGIELCGDYEKLFRKKQGFREDSNIGKLGSIAAQKVLGHLRPAYWFSGHLHVKYEAVVEHEARTVETTIKKVASVHESKSVEAPQTDKKVSNADEIDVVMSSDSDKEVIMHKGITPKPKLIEPKIPTPLPQVEKKAALGAWNSFHQKAQKEEGEESRRAQAELAARLEQERLTGVREVKKLNITETWRRVEVGEGTAREVVEAKKRKMGGQIDGPTDDYGSPTQPTNSDEIKVDLSESSGDEAAAVAEKAGETHKDGEVPADLRAQLPESFKKATSPPAAQVHAPARPTDIKNSSTSFLALDKVATKRDFVQVMEIEPVSKLMEFELGENSPKRLVDGKHRLQYDPEWLAITRCFTGSLFVGDESIPAPRDMGDAFYAEAIALHADWVKENVVEKDLLDIPRNFSIVAPVYDANEIVGLNDQPREYPNPQTAAYCDLLQIPNKFAISEAELQSRIDAGPRAATPRFAQNNRRGRGGFQGGNNVHGGFQGGRGGYQGGHGGRGGGGNHGGNRGGNRGGFWGGRGRGGGQPQFAARNADGPSPEAADPDTCPRGRVESRNVYVPPHLRGNSEARTHSSSPGPKPTTRSESSSRNRVSWGSLPMPAPTQTGTLISF